MLSRTYREKKVLQTWILLKQLLTLYLPDDMTRPASGTGLFVQTIHHLSVHPSIHSSIYSFIHHKTNDFLPGARDRAVSMDSLRQHVRQWTSRQTAARAWRWPVTSDSIVLFIDRVSIRTTQWFPALPLRLAGLQVTFAEGIVSGYRREMLSSQELFFFLSYC